MKALTPQELMIGDFVKFKQQDNPELGCDEEKIESGEEIDFAKEGCFFPRKITKETLKIIGFRESDVDSYSLTKDTGRLSHFSIFLNQDLKSTSFTVSIFNKNATKKNGYDYQYHGSKIRYYHELQQAMRVCKIDAKFIGL